MPVRQDIEEMKFNNVNKGSVLDMGQLHMKALGSALDM